MRRGLCMAGAALTLAIAGCATRVPETDIALNGNQEVPPVQTSAKGTGSVQIDHDGNVSGRIATSGITANQAHLHVGFRGRNGRVLMPLARDGDNAWTIPAGTKLTPEQYNFYREGNLYVNVHSTAHPDGEIRGQVVPKVALPPPGGY